MNCPRCRSSEIDSSGMCLVCGCKAPESDEKPAQVPAEIFLEEDDDIELELQSIIDAAISRQTASVLSEKSGEFSSMPVSEEPAFRETREKDELTADMFVDAEDDTPSSPSAEFGKWLSVPSSEEGASRGTDEGKSAVSLFVATEEGVPDGSAASDITNTAETESMVSITDSAEIGIVIDAGKAEDTGDFPYAANASNPEGRLIFLSRTLSGLVDLLLIALCSGVFLCAADYFTNAPLLYSINVVSFTTLFLMIYFLYSIFLLGINGQTVGMMAVDLRIIGTNKDRPSVKQVACRSAAFLVSLFGLGIGLLAGVFSRKYLCLHDRLSTTRVVRISEHAD